MQKGVYLWVRWSIWRDLAWASSFGFCHFDVEGICGVIAMYPIAS
jgi:hypothetical protein